MNIIGLLGGMSWESTVTYYQVINRRVQEALGGLHSARCLLHSVDFHEIEACQAAGEWERSGEILGRAAQGLERAGAGLLVICTNTMHKVAPQIQGMIHIPLLHIADVTARAIRAAGLERVALLGTRYTMEQDFYRVPLEQAGLTVLTPPAEQRAEVDRVIFRELCLGTLRPESKAYFLEAIRGLGERGAQGVILGCTEIGLLVEQADTPLPVFDTTLLHAAAAADWSMGKMTRF